MKLLLYLFVFLTLLQSSASAQNFADSLYKFQQDLNRTGFAYKGVTQLIGSGITQSSRVGLKYHAEQGHYRRAQEAETGSNALVFTDGIRSIGKFKFAGHFSFGRDWQDSLAWSTRIREDDMTPYYYGAIKAGKFEKLAYDLGGLISYQLSNKIHVGSGISYEYQSLARSVDPRAKINLFELELRPELVIRAGKNLFGMHGAYGYANENTTISFKNDNFRLSLGYPDRINYYLRGYGFLDRTRHGYQSAIKTSRASAAGLSHDYRNGRTHVQTLISLGHLLEQNSKELTNSSRDTNTSEFIVDTYNLNILYSYPGEKYQHQLQLSAQIIDAFDRDLVLLGSNYFYTRNDVSANYLIRATAAGRSVSPELGIGFSYEDVSRKDLSSAHAGSYQIIEPGLLGNFYFHDSGPNQFRLGVGASYRYPLSSSLSVPASQETVFTAGVIYPDQDYHSSEAITGRTNLSWFNTSLFKQFTLGVIGAVTYTSRLDQPGTWSNLNFSADKSRLNTNFGVNLFF